MLEEAPEVLVLGAEVEDAELGAQRVAGNGHAREDAIGELGQEHPVLERPRLPLVGVVVALATVGLALGLWIRALSPTDPPAQQKSTQQLRLEYESLQEEVESLRSLAAQPPPVLYLGGDSRIDLVLDLGQVDPRATQPNIRPAAIGPEGRRNP